jgi:hypothetical protein
VLDVKDEVGGVGAVGHVSCQLVNK